MSLKKTNTEAHVLDIFLVLQVYKSTNPILFFALEDLEQAPTSQKLEACSLCL